jgi:hypothetical protein
MLVMVMVTPADRTDRDATCEPLIRGQVRRNPVPDVGRATITCATVRSAILSSTASSRSITL